ncbi:glycosyltransferase [Lentzea sp. NPDC051208]|uniref:glycosyltransferase n=1 Tax=Lentzea sp. NPDC051208 TaxID=3154642 RepID=UPI00341DA0F9
MRILFLAGGSPATVFPLVPLATAARNAGHEVLMAGTEGITSSISGAGLPALSVSPLTMLDFFTNDKHGNSLEWPPDPEDWKLFIGRGFGRLARASMEPLLDLARSWRPDVVVGGQLAFVAPLLAKRLGVPYVRHTWDSGEPPEADLGAAEELEPEFRELGLDGFPVADLHVELCPPSLLPPGPAPANLQHMRYVASSPQRTLEPWMYTRPERRRICVTAGCRVTKDQYFDFLRDLAGKVAPLGAEIVVAAPEDVARDLTAGLDNVHAGWLPLDVVARTCDLFVHHAGGGTSLLVMAAGLPQLLIPNMPSSVAPSQRLTDFGASLMLMPGEDTLDAVVSGCQELLENPSYTERARVVADEIRSQPLPVDVLAIVEELV